MLVVKLDEMLVVKLDNMLVVRLDEIAVVSMVEVWLAVFVAKAVTGGATFRQYTTHDHIMMLQQMS